MCGIVGYVGPAIPGVLEEMAATVAHRGPDQRAFWSDPDQGVHLGHTRLAILDRDGGRQPMSTPSGELVVVFNGEIYNAPALRVRLEARGHRFRSDHSDTEILLHGYREWGMLLPEKLNGMWAFVIYDRVRRQLFASRDRFGEKPFYYTATEKNFLFGSELKALQAHPSCPTQVDRLALKKYFAHGFIPAPRTLLSRVQKLPAGHSLLYDVGAGEISLRCYWQFVLDPAESSGPDAEQRLADELLDRLRGAVRRQLVADASVGVLMSGGVDSSAIAALAVAERGRNRIESFNIGFEEPSYDESVHARVVAERLGTIHHSEVLDAATAEHLLPGIRGQLDEPMGDPSLLPTYALAKLARRHVKVALGGDGADELFAGYDPFRALRVANTYKSFVPRPLHEAISYLCARLPVSHQNLSFDFKLKRFVRGVGQSPALWNSVWLAPLSGRELAELFSESTDIEELYSEAISTWDALPNGSIVDRSLQFFTRIYLQNILTKIDRASMLHSLEVRSPFLDFEVVEFVRRLPSHWKLRGGCTKYLLKRALERVLPTETLRRKKKGFGAPIGLWFQQGHLSSVARDASLELNWDFVGKAMREHRAKVQDHRQLLWCAGMLQSRSVASAA